MPVPQEGIDDLLARSSSIQHMALERGVNLSGLMEHQGAPLVSSMTSALNNFPADEPKTT